MRKKLIQLIQGNYDQKQAAVIQIITLNVIFFSLSVLLSFIFFLFNELTTIISFLRYFYLPSDFSDFIHQPWSLLTFQFFHSLENPFHIVFNLLWLYWFGRTFNFYFGGKRVWFLYLLGGIVGGLIFMIAYNVFPVFTRYQQTTYLLGASAGVTAIVIALATYMPNFEVYTLLGSIKLKWIALITILMDFALTPNGFNSGGHIAHLGGAFFGFLYMFAYQKNIDLSNFIKWFQKKSYQPKIKIINSYSQNQSSKSTKPTQQEIDRILDKIAAQGYDQLTQEEKQTLYNASKD
jgi:membrane associated rhomboid family serine protease